MSCCGHRRQAYRAAAQPLEPVPLPPATRLTIAVEHLGDHPMVIGGSVSGTAYLFGPRGSTLPVDERDVGDLVATGRFERH